VIGGGQVWPRRFIFTNGAHMMILRSSPPPLSAMPNVGDIALACCLGHRNLRFPGSWRADHPKLAAWLDRFAAQVPAFSETKIAA
jgi:glutathione S-transferase